MAALYNLQQNVFSAQNVFLLKWASWKQTIAKTKKTRWRSILNKKADLAEADYCAVAGIMMCAVASSKGAVAGSYISENFNSLGETKKRCLAVVWP